MENNLNLGQKVKLWIDNLKRKGKKNCNEILARPKIKSLKKRKNLTWTFGGSLLTFGSDLLTFQICKNKNIF